MEEIVEVTLEDQETGRQYTLLVTAQEEAKLRSDLNYATLKLAEAINEAAAEEIENSERSQLAEVEAASAEENLQSNQQEEAGTASAGAYRWRHNAVLLLIEEYRKRDGSTTSQKKLWDVIASQLKALNHNVTGPQCQSKFAGLKKQYKVIKDHNGKSGNDKKSWLYYEVMDSLMAEKPFMSPVATVSSTGKRTHSTSESSDECSPRRPRLNPIENVCNLMKEREENRERRHKEKMDKLDKFINLMQNLQKPNN